MEYPRKFFDALSRWLTGEPCDVLLLLCFTLIACMSFFAVLVFLWLLSKHVITLEDLYHLGSLVFFGLAGWLGWREFSVSNRAEQIEQLDNLQRALVPIWKEVSSNCVLLDIERVLSDLEKANHSYGYLAGHMLSRVGAVKVEKYQREYFSEVSYLSSGIRSEIDSFLSKQRELINSTTELVYLYLMEGEVYSGGFDLHKIEQINRAVYERIESGINNYPITGAIYVGKPDSYVSDRPYWEAVDDPFPMMGLKPSPVKSFLDEQLRQSTMKLNGQKYIKIYQRYLLQRLDDAIQKELKRLVRSR